MFNVTPQEIAIAVHLVCKNIAEDSRIIGGNATTGLIGSRYNKDGALKPIHITKDFDHWQTAFWHHEEKYISEGQFGDADAFVPTIISNAKDVKAEEETKEKPVESKENHDIRTLPDPRDNEADAASRAVLHLHKTRAISYLAEGLGALNVVSGSNNEGISVDRLERVLVTIGDSEEFQWKVHITAQVVEKDGKVYKKRSWFRIPMFHDNGMFVHHGKVYASSYGVDYARYAERRAALTLGKDARTVEEFLAGMPAFVLKHPYTVLIEEAIKASFLKGGKFLAQHFVDHKGNATRDGGMSLPFYNAINNVFKNAEGENKADMPIIFVAPGMEIAYAKYGANSIFINATDKEEKSTPSSISIIDEPVIVGVDLATGSTSRIGGRCQTSIKWQITQFDDNGRARVMLTQKEVDRSQKIANHQCRSTFEGGTRTSTKRTDANNLVHTSPVTSKKRSHIKSLAICE